MLIQVFPCLLPFVSDLGTASVELAQEAPEIDVEDLEIVIADQIWLAFVALQERFVVDGGW